MTAKEFLLKYTFQVEDENPEQNEKIVKLMEAYLKYKHKENVENYKLIIKFQISPTGVIQADWGNGLCMCEGENLE